MTVQEPAATSVNVVPLTEQTVDGEDVKVTVNPEDALADRAGVAVPRVWFPGPAKVIV